MARSSSSRCITPIITTARVFRQGAPWHNACTIGDTCALYHITKDLRTLAPDMAESTTPRASAGDPSMSLRPALQALLSNARLVTGARAVALAVPAGPDGRLTLISVDGDALTAGATLDPDTMPGLR